MKNSLPIILSLFYTSVTYGAPCNGAPGSFYRNPDGSNGGFVARGTQVANTVYIDPDSEVCGNVTIRGSAKVLRGSRVEENVVIEGSSLIVSSHIFGDAKVTGGAIVQNSTVCQGSLIEGFKVIGSDYYCQTEDPAPKDPGEEGRKSLLGVDSDGDGVRDDIEVFINNSLPNTQKADRAEERIASKVYAKILQKEIVLKEKVSSIKALLQEKTDLRNCYRLSLGEDIFLNMYDNKERMFSLFKIAGYLHGEETVKPNKTCKKLSAFSARVDEL